MNFNLKIFSIDYTGKFKSIFIGLSFLTEHLLNSFCCPVSDNHFGQFRKANKADANRFQSNQKTC